MKVRLNSSAPHIHPASEWRTVAANENTLVLYKSPDGDVEVGIRRWQQGGTDFFCENDMFCYFQHGRGFFRRETGESIEVTPGTAVQFKEDWRGRLESSEPLDASYMTCGGAPPSTLLSCAMFSPPHVI